MQAMEFDGNGFRLLDQRLLPEEETWVECRTAGEVAEAIRNMTVRGAPAIGIAAAYALALEARRLAGQVLDGAELVRHLKEAAQLLKTVRPTAVNLSWAVDRMLGRLDQAGVSAPDELVAMLAAEARSIHEEDVAMNKRIGLLGRDLLDDGAGVLTHCNAGALATGGVGTALGVIRAARDAGKKLHVFVNETRPVLQGSRLTAFELLKEGIASTLITDGMAGFFMSRGEIRTVIVGADRIAANGDVANKIGTYSLAVLAREHGIPFYVAAPWSTVDLSVKSGEDIPIEERDPAEVTQLAGKLLAPAAVKAANPAFDITPARLVSALITDRGVVYAPFEEGLRQLA